MAYQDMSSNWFYKKPVLAADLNQLGANDEYIFNYIKNLSFNRYVNDLTGTLVACDLTEYEYPQRGNYILINTLNINSNLPFGRSLLRFKFEAHAPHASYTYIQIKLKNTSGVEYSTKYIAGINNITTINNEYVSRNIWYIPIYEFESIDVISPIGLVVEDSSYKLDIYARNDEIGGINPNRLRNFYVYEFPPLII